MLCRWTLVTRYWEDLQGLTTDPLANTDHVRQLAYDEPSHQSKNVAGSLVFSSATRKSGYLMDEEASIKQSDSSPHSNHPHQLLSSSHHNLNKLSLYTPVLQNNSRFLHIHPSTTFTNSITMFSKIILTAIAATSVLAAPGGGDWGSGYNYPSESVSCSTSYCTSSSTYAVPTTIIESKTVYVPYTTYSKSQYLETKTYTKTETSYITTSTPYVTTIWKPVTISTCVEVPYPSVCTEETEVPVVTSSASVSVCTETSKVPYTTQWVETETVCTTATVGWGATQSAGW